MNLNTLNLKPSLVYNIYICYLQIWLKPQRACTIVIACAVLHNIVITLGEPEDEDDLIEDNIQQLIQAYQGPQDGRHFRDYVTDVLTIILPEHNDFHFGFRLIMFRCCRSVT